MNSILQDLSYGLRGLRRQPAFAALAILALALGIGATTTMFSVIDSILLHQLPYVDAERVVLLGIHDVTKNPDWWRGWFTVPEFLDYQQQNHVFDDVIGGGYDPVHYASREGAEFYRGSAMTANTFRLVRMPAFLGRTLLPEDAKPGAPPVFLMSHKMWSKRFNLDPSILGRTFVLNGTSRTLVGIMPARFTKLGADLWLPAVLDRSDPETRNKDYFFQAHLKPGVTLPQAQADLDILAHRLALVYPKLYPPKFTVRLQTVNDWLLGPYRTTLYTLLAAVSLLLLIACGNVANMLLARATAREKEMAIRSSIGASRWRLIRQLLNESLLLALGGAAIGCMVAFGGIKALTAVVPGDWVPGGITIGLNVTVLLANLATAVVTVLLFGLAPALQTVKQNIAEPLKDSGKGVSGGFRRGKLRNTLVVIEVALSIVLLVGAGLLMRSFFALQHVDLGLNPANVLVGSLSFPPQQYKTAAARQHFFVQFLEQMSGPKGISSAALTSGYPMYSGGSGEVEIPGKKHAEKWIASFELCSEAYFTTLRIPHLRGRPLSQADMNGARKVAVVNQALVKKYFGQEDPIGRQIEIIELAKTPEPVKNPVFEIVGVVADAKNQGIRDPVQPEVFLPYTIAGGFNATILVRTPQDPLLVLNTVQRQVWAVDRNVAFTEAARMQDLLKTWEYEVPRFSFMLLATFAGLGLVLVAIGVYSVVAYTVSRQTHEIGIRMALGASRVDVLRLVLRMGVWLIGSGVLAGSLASLGLTRFIASQLWNVSPNDPATLCSVVAVVLIAGVSACYFPARRATRVDPMVALRYE